MFPDQSRGQSNFYAEISGTVTDATGKNPLPGANIVWSERNAGTVTDINGKFILRVPAGSGILKASFIGYQSFQKKMELQKSQKYVLKIQLKDTVLSSSPVQIYGERGRDNTEQSFRVNVISASAIELAPSQSIHSLLDYAPGVNLSNTGGIFSSKAVVTMRGLPANDQSRTLVVLDGVPLNKADEGSVNWNMINKNTIASVKTIKGPGPAQYGSGAMGGVIEMVSKKPEKKLDGILSVDYGTYNTMSSNLSLDGKVGKDTTGRGFYWGMTASGKKSDGYITEPEQFITAADSVLSPVFLKEINTNVKAGYDLGRNQNIEAQFGYYDDIRGNGVKVYDNYGAYQKHTTLHGQARYSGNAGFFTWNAAFYDLSENFYRLYEYLKDGEYSLYQADSKRQDMGGNVSTSYLKFRKHRITAGGAFRLGSVDGTDTYFTSTDIIKNQGKMDEWSCFIQDELRLLHDKLTVNAGLRYDLALFHDGLFSIDEPSYTIIFYKEFENKAMADKRWNALCPRFSAGYQLSGTSRIYLSVARGFRAPILDDMCRSGKKKGGFMIANPDLKPETIISNEIGGDVELFKHFTVGASLFYNTGKDFMYYVSNGDTVNMGYKLAPVIEKQNIGKVRIYGSEVEIKYEIKNKLTVFANYTYTYSKIIEHVVNNPLVDSNLTGKYLTDIPDHKVSAGITWRNKIVNTSFLYKYVGKIWINDMNGVPLEYFQTPRYPDYGIFSVKFEREVYHRISLSLNIENIFDKIYFDNNLVKCPGRFITGTVMYHFTSRK